ncbi:MAG: rhomboid family intramembrane serine protease [Myxococcaceae bacterium]
MVLRRDDAFGPASGPLPEAPPAASAVPAGRRPLPPFCTGLIAVCVAVFLAQLSGVEPDFLRGDNLALYGPAVQAGQWWRVLTWVVVHGGPLHILFNMMVVVNLGFAVERLLGTPRMVAVSLVTALGSAALVLAFAFRLPTVGASGVILGWAGALLPVVNRQGRQSLAWLLVQVAVISLLPGVSWQGHLGGFLAGLACGGLLRLGPNRFNQLWPLLALVLAGAVGLLGSTGGLPPP